MGKHIKAAGLALSLITVPSVAQDWQTLDGRSLSSETIDTTMERLIAANKVSGFALALISSGEVAYIKGYGHRMVEKDLPLEPDTVLYGASLTKSTFAYLVMQLVDEGLIDLDKPISGYLPKPLPEYEEYNDLADDNRWEQLTMRLLLSHQAGFMNWRFLTPEGGFDRNGKLYFFVDPGTQYAYSGEGMLLAQRVLEWGLNMDVSSEMQRRIFDPLNMQKTSLLWRDDFRENYAHNYTLDGRNIRHNEQDNVNVAGSMDTTIADWSKFLSAVVRGEGLTAASKSEMVKPQVRIRSIAQFPTFDQRTTDTYDNIELSYGLGWGVFKTPFGHAFFKEGHDDGTANYAICIEPQKACMLMMSNSVRAEGIFKEVVETLLGDVKLPWHWENYIPYNMESEQADQ